MSRDRELQQGLADHPAHDVLRAALLAAVPLWMVELRRMTVLQRAERVESWAAESADAVAAKGDVLQYGSRRRGEAADTFNHLARGLAAAAQAPGGVVFAGMHWCVEHPWGIGCTSILDLTCSAAGLEPIPPAAAPSTPAVATIVTTEVL
jgi:hypothetical protein